jgi:hypothetical protein
MLNKEDLAQISSLFDQKLVDNNNRLFVEFDKRLDQKLVDNNKLLDQKFEQRLDEKLRPLKQEVARLERSIEAIETMPVPNGRPKTYLSATESHSVTGSRRTNYGYQG